MMGISQGERENYENQDACMVTDNKFYLDLKHTTKSGDDGAYYWENPHET